VNDSTLKHLRIIYFGMAGDFSFIPFQYLLDNSINICAVVIPGAMSNNKISGGQLPVIVANQQETIESRANTLGIPILHLDASMDEISINKMSACKPDVIIIACFPYKLPGSIYTLPRSGCFNLHPSLLPAYRGPAPLFWQLRAGEQAMGMTVHYVDDGIDTGDIVGQSRLTLVDGMSNGEITAILGKHGGKLLLALLEQLVNNSLVRIPQDNTKSSYQSWPEKKDFTLSSLWSAQHACNFMKGTEERGQSYTIETGSECFVVHKARSFSLTEKLDAAYVIDGNNVRIQFSPGVLDVLIEG